MVLGVATTRYGALDEIGALNEITPDHALTAARLVRRGHIFDLAHVLDETSPAFPGRTFTQRIAERAPDGGVGANHVHWVAERFEATTQMGTHVDGLNHLHIGERAYNGNLMRDILTERGTSRLGIETMPQVITRGVLIDVAGQRGVAQLEPGEVIGPDDLQGARLRPADAVLFHTGWGRLWYADPERYVSGEPGPGWALAELLVDARVALVGCDTWSFGPVPAEDPDRPFAVPQALNVNHGVVVMENLWLHELASAGVGEFMFVMAHPKLRGATGAWIAPLAVV